MTDNFSTSTWTRNATTAGTVTGSSRYRCTEAEKTLTTIEKLNEAVHASVINLDKMKKDKPDGKLIRQKQALRKAERDLRLTQNSFDEQVETQAKALCRPLCELAYERLPQKLRDMIVRHLIKDSSATFFSNKHDKVCLVNGTSDLQHVFGEEYTGIGLHVDISTMLLNMGVRFDFRARHELLGKISDYYAGIGIRLPAKIKFLSVVVMERHLKDREVVLAQLERLVELGKDADILVIVEVGEGTKVKVIYRVRRVIRMIFPLLTRLRECGIYIHVVVNPVYTASKVKNGSDVTFSIARDGPWRYEMTPENAEFTVASFEHHLRESFEEYGDDWNSRIPPLDS